MNVFNSGITYEAGKVEEQVSYEYVKKVGIFAVKLIDLFAYEKESGTSTTVDFYFQINNTDEVLQISSLLSYTKGSEEVMSLGHTFITSFMGISQQSKKVTASWSKVTKNKFGKNVEGFTIKKLIGKKFNIYTNIERSIYNNKLMEKTTIRRIFSEAELSLAEHEESLVSGVVEPKVINTVRASIEKRLANGKLYTYKKCTEEEWLDLKEEQEDDDTSANSSKDSVTTTNELPSLGDTSAEPSTEDALPSLDNVSTEESTTPATATTTDEQPVEGDALPSLDI